MTKNSMASLSETLQQRLKDDQQAVSLQTEQLLARHASDLELLSAQSLTTTRSAIESHQKSLLLMHKSTVQRMRWMLLWPVIATVILCVLMLGSASLYSLWKVSQSDDLAAAQQAQIRQSERAFCATPVGLKICKGEK